MFKKHGRFFIIFSAFAGIAIFALILITILYLDSSDMVYHKTLTSESGQEFDVRIVYYQSLHPSYNIEIRCDKNNTSVTESADADHLDNHMGYIPKDAYSQRMRSNEYLFWVKFENGIEFINYINRDDKISQRLYLGEGFIGALSSYYEKLIQAINQKNLLDKIDSSNFDKDKWQSYIDEMSAKIAAQKSEDTADMKGQT